VARETTTYGWPVDTPPPVDALIAQLAGRQHGVLTLRQLQAAGLGWSSITRRLNHGRLHRIHRGVYAVGHRRLSREGQWLAAVLASGDGAVLSHLTAAVLWNTWRRKLTTVDVLAPRARALHGAEVHRVRHLDPCDVTVRTGIPVTTMARTLVDLTECLTRHQLANVIHEAAFRNRFSATHAREAMTRANGRHRLGSSTRRSTRTSPAVPAPGATSRTASSSTTSSSACPNRA